MSGADSGERLRILQHALGLDEHGQGRAYRNHFVTEPGNVDHDHCLALLTAGLMKRHAPSELTGGADLFTVTEAGRTYVAQHSPPPPRLTPGQQRYRRFLNADSGMTFGEWLKVYGGRMP